MTRCAHLALVQIWAKGQEYTADRVLQEYTADRVLQEYTADRVLQEYTADRVLSRKKTNRKKSNLSRQLPANMNRLSRLYSNIVGGHSFFPTCLLTCKSCSAQQSSLNHLHSPSLLPPPTPPPPPTMQMMIN